MVVTGPGLGLGPGLVAWRRPVEARWTPTRRCRDGFCSVAAVVSVRTVLLSAARIDAAAVAAATCSGGGDGGDGDSITAPQAAVCREPQLPVLPALPMELWHHVLGCVFPWELRPRPTGVPLPRPAARVGFGAQANLQLGVAPAF